MTSKKNYKARLLLGLGLSALTPLLLGFLCFPLVAPPPSGVVTPTPAAIFAPTVGVDVTDTAPGARSNIVLNISVPVSSTLPIGITFDVPAGWTVASDVHVANGSIVGSIDGFMTVADPIFFNCNTPVEFDPLEGTAIDLLEATTDTSVKVAGTDTDGNGEPEVVEDSDESGLPDGVDKYPAFLNTILPGTPKARYFGHTEAGGLSNLYVNIVVDELAPGGPYQVTTIVNDPTAPPESAASQFCAPQSFTLTLFGTSADNPATGATEGGQTVYRNPALSGSYTFTATLVSEFDLDNDGVSNGLDNCPATSNAMQTDTDEDYVGDACEQDSEPNFDVDDDGVENGYDNCIFQANADQADGDYDDIGNACDANPTTPDGPNYYLNCIDPVGIGRSDPGGAHCGESVATPTPVPVGGIAELPSIGTRPLESPGSSGGNNTLTATLVAAAATSAVALLGAAWYVKRRRVRS